MTVPISIWSINTGRSGDSEKSHCFRQTDRQTDRQTRVTETDTRVNE